MTATGFVLAGGRSTRMGQDKALLPYGGSTMVQHVATLIQQVVGNVTIVGDPLRYGHLGHPVHADLIPDIGPLGGIHAALSVSRTDWSLIVACDMPGVSSAVLESLLARLEQTQGLCVVAVGPEGEPEPLCAVYHRHSLPVLDRAIKDKRFKMRNLIPELRAEPVPVDGLALANMNTPAEWVEFDERPR